MKTKMRVSTVRLGLLALAASSMIVFLGCQQEDITSQDENLVANSIQTQTRAAGPSANGQGTLTFDGIPIAGEGFRHFTFHAREKSNGTVEGSGVLTYTGGVRKMSFNIECLAINGNVAVMSGVITRDNQIPANEGLLCWFKVVDNGEGAGADPDEITLFYSGTNPGFFTCVNHMEPLYAIEGGNIQVKE
jgi:hypothetical protein